MAPTVLRCGTLFDSTGADPVPGGVVVIDDGRIAAAGPADRTPYCPKTHPMLRLRDGSSATARLTAHGNAPGCPGAGGSRG
jgi:hypothetical protein